MTLRPTYKQIQILTQHPDSPVRFGSITDRNLRHAKISISDVLYIAVHEQFLRGIGFLFLRYCCDPKQLWAWFQPNLKDPEEMQIRKFDKRKGTVGQFLCEILINVEYEATHVRVKILKVLNKMTASPCAALNETLPNRIFNAHA